MPGSDHWATGVATIYPYIWRWRRLQRGKSQGGRNEKEVLRVVIDDNWGFQRPNSRAEDILAEK
ncbi:hypothetical protein K402DRAFT_394296 [Aulographum hederae CBS 113979]|uniref:Uncharacterized protein n=1 Tax=Aulographum hederae CBS 113979 TaxID=1176131 RepID=A0A6G1GZ79_9PEZI|nr:hypothetical protein K402DRAFT_396030 [Aulographum hederae CBS 113979]KAF1985617.1 hypothetical protein K402DRAFT_394600 [Aulographum hederae CBS 113979]KAF1986059.1 hypothetical protein K402DRAFT_394296 [Aulographum hederae CBS 113979]